MLIIRQSRNRGAEGSELIEIVALISARFAFEMRCGQ